MAKYTFFNLDQYSKENVETVTFNMLRRGAFSNPIDRLKSMTERERYGFYAMSMAELGINPKLGNERWTFIANPFVALI
jgi:hypothetical protein